LTVELVLSNRVQDLLRREADIAVRMARPRQGLLVARRIGQIKLGLYAHQRYLTRHGTPSSIADLAAHSLIGFDETTEFLRNASRSFPVWRREAFAMRTDSDLAQMALIRSNAGIGVCQTAIARRDEAIVRVLPKQFSLPLETWITMHKDLRNSRSCRVTFEALVEGLQRTVCEAFATFRKTRGARADISSTACSRAATQRTGSQCQRWVQVCARYGFIRRRVPRALHAEPASPKQYTY
jgi:DNA-binding transcriptional LysR family regulator